MCQYPHSEEYCKFLDSILIKIKNAKNLYPFDTAREDDETSVIRILVRDGYIKDVGKQSTTYYYQISIEGNKFLINGGYCKDRENFYQSLEDKQQVIEEKKLDTKDKNTKRKIATGSLIVAILGLIFTVIKFCI